MILLFSTVQRFRRAQRAHGPAEFIALVRKNLTPDAVPQDQGAVFISPRIIQIFSTFNSISFHLVFNFIFICEIMYRRKELLQHKWLTQFIEAHVRPEKELTKRTYSIYILGSQAHVDESSHREREVFYGTH